MTPTAKSEYSYTTGMCNQFSSFCLSKQQFVWDSLQIRDFWLAIRKSFRHCFQTIALDASVPLKMWGWARADWACLVHSFYLRVYFVKDEKPLPCKDSSMMKYCFATSDNLLGLFLTKEVEPLSLISFTEITGWALNCKQLCDVA